MVEKSGAFPEGSAEPYTFVAFSKLWQMQHFKYLDIVIHTDTKQLPTNNVLPILS